MENIIIILIIVCIIAGIVLYLRKAKKQGQKCIGCPYCKQCAGKKAGGCGGEHSCGTQNCHCGSTGADNNAIN